jgi:hypothetical protein
MLQKSRSCRKASLLQKRNESRQRKTNGKFNKIIFQKICKKEFQNGALFYLNFSSKNSLNLSFN